jgi:DNA polymerase III alpha subunit
MPEVFERLKAVGCESAAIVDWGTWGHVRWAQAAEKSGIHPMFGMEVPLLIEGSTFKPKAWMLARDTKLFYNATSRIIQNKGLEPEEFGDLEGVIKFPGGAVEILEPYQYDFIDINPSSFLHASEGVNKSRETGKQMVITGYNDMPSNIHESFAYAWEVRDSVGCRSIVGEGMAWEFLQHVMTYAEFDHAVLNAYWIEDVLKETKLQRAPLIHLPGDLPGLCREGQRSRLERGHIEEWTSVYEERLVEEIKQIQAKDFDSYFLVVADLMRYAKSQMLCGPARGSSAGSLVCYLIGITEVDPIPHKLLFQRFIDISRSDLPDIDLDFSDTKRHLVFEYLQDKYGRENVAKLGNINTLKAASVLAHVGKKFQIPIGDTMLVRNSMIDYASGDARFGKGLNDTFENTGPGQSFKKKYEAAARCMSDLELHPSHSSVHAAGIIVCNDKISDYCTVNEEGVAQIDKPNAEYLNLLKIDALGLRTLGIIEDCGVVTAEELYGLKLNDQAVFDILNEGKVSGIFQFEGDAVQSVTKNVHIDMFSKIDNLTALARPGPLASGMAKKYIDRVSGKEKITYDIPQLEPYLKDTYGVVLYQEAVMSISKEIGLFDWATIAIIRKAMSGSKGEEYFNQMGEKFVIGATSQGIAEDQARIIWKNIVTFGSWAFNKSHSVSYAIVTYWTCWLKRYHKLEFAAACLRTAKDDNQTIAILRELVKEGVEYTPLDPDYSDMNWKVADGRLVGGIQNAKGYGPVKALTYIQKRDAGKLTEKDRARLAAAQVLYADLCEAHTKWGHYYHDPRLAGVTSGNPITEIKSVIGGDTCLIIGKLMKKILADENEAIRIKKRGGTLWKGPSAFIDLMLVDDSTDYPLRFRIRANLYQDYGLKIANEAAAGSWWLVKAWKIRNSEMFIIKNIKAL